MRKIYAEAQNGSQSIVSRCICDRCGHKLAFEWADEVVLCVAQLDGRVQHSHMIDR